MNTNFYSIWLCFCRVVGGDSLGVPPGTFDRHGGVIGLGGNPSSVETVAEMILDNNLRTVGPDTNP